MSESVKIIPEDYHSINPYIVVRNADRAIEFYKKAFGAEERFCMQGRDGKTIMHAELNR
jgi:PhnB protein